MTKLDFYITVEPLQCWASWTETDSHNNAFQFIILGKPGKPPQYALVSNSCTLLHTTSIMN